ncbi:MAG: rRNA pseudouridine synthase [Candidatus Kapabacteria bacterium]|nr:rRNA pseudouridine synthase [Candidatus Kapabacteria bacterium]
MPSPKNRSSDRRGKTSSTSRTTSERSSSTRSRRSDGPAPAARSASPRSRRSDGPAPASRSSSTRTRRSDGPAPASRSSSTRTRRSDDPAPAAKQRQSRPKRSDIVEPSQPVRLNKAIADAGVASRRRADELISSGCVRINGAIVVDLGTRVEIDDVVTVNGEPITRQKHLTYILLNKPKDLITTSRDEKGRATVFDIVRLKTRLFSVGRLDRNTTGVLLLTNDGDLANRLMHPRYGVTRVYRASLDHPLRTDHMRRIASGVELEDGPTQPCDVIIDPEDKTVVVLAIREGRNREVRRIFEHVGYEVKRLDRKEYAGLSTRGLKRGEYRHLTRDEVDQLYRLVNLTQ